MTISGIKKRPDDNTIRMSKRHKEPPVTGNDDFYGKKNYHMGNKLVNSSFFILSNLDTHIQFVSSY
jgi:hypothetical protein